MWLLLAGRGFGKTRTGAEFVRSEIEAGRAGRVGLIAPTAADARDVMVEGPGGILSCCPPWDRPTYEPSKRRLTWPNGAVGTTYSADEPERLRGPQHDLIWADELAAWRYPGTWDMAMFGLRLGKKPRAVVTTTPKPIALLRELIDASTTVLTRGTTYENRDNLAEAFFEQVIAKYEGTRLGQQELEATLLEEAEGALWKRETIDRSRVAIDHNMPDIVRVVVSMDPAVTKTANSDEMGLVVAGLGSNGHAYVLEDASDRMTPDEAAKEALRLFRLWEADRIVAEVNNGGDWIEAVLRGHDRNVSYKSLKASKGKQARAEPVAALYEQGKVHHVGVFRDLEDQMCTWEPDGKTASPDRLDALAWALTELMLQAGGARMLRYTGW